MQEWNILSLIRKINHDCVLQFSFVVISYAIVGVRRVENDLKECVDQRRISSRFYLDLLSDRRPDGLRIMRKCMMTEDNEQFVIDMRALDLIGTS